MFLFSVNIYSCFFDSLQRLRHRRYIPAKLRLFSLISKFFLFFHPSAFIPHPSSFNYQKSLISSYTSYTSITNPLYIGLCVVRDVWEMCRIGALFNKILTLFCTTICFLFTPLHSLLTQSVALQSLTEQSVALQSGRGQGWVFHPLEYFVPPHGTTYSTRWNNLFHPLEQLARCTVLPFSLFRWAEIKIIHRSSLKIAKGDHSKFNTQNSTFALIFS